MANGFKSFSDDHHYASGIILVTVGLVGVVGSLTGYLPSMLAALFVPDILFTQSNQQADQPLGSTVATAESAANTLNAINPITGPLTWLKDTVGIP